MTSLRQAMVLLVATLLAAAGTHLFHPHAPQWYVKAEPLAADEVTVDLVQQKWRGEVIWLDARPRDAFTKSHIPGALLLNEQERDTLLFEHIDVLQDSKKPLVVYCDGHSCQASRKIANFLRERLGDADIFVLKGGWKAWTEKHPEK